MGSTFYQLCPRYSRTLTSTAPMANRLWETFTFTYFKYFLCFQCLVIIQMIISLFQEDNAISAKVVSLAAFKYFKITKQLIQTEKKRKYLNFETDKLKQTTIVGPNACCIHPLCICSCHSNLYLAVAVIQCNMYKITFSFPKAGKKTSNRPW